MPDPTTPTIDSRFEMLLGAIKSRQENWRRAVKSGVVAVSMSDYPTYNLLDSRKAAIDQNTIYGFSKLSLEDLEFIADSLGCVWSMNPQRRVYYFIPKEIMGEEL